MPSGKIVSYVFSLMDMDTLTNLTDRCFGQLIMVPFLFSQLLMSCVSHLNAQAIASQLVSHDEKILIVSINCLSKVNPFKFYS
jgi:hypothetical protein